MILLKNAKVFSFSQSCANLTLGCCIGLGGWSSCLANIGIVVWNRSMHPREWLVYVHEGHGCDYIGMWTPNCISWYNVHCGLVCSPFRSSIVVVNQWPLVWRLSWGSSKNQAHRPPPSHPRQGPANKTPKMDQPWKSECPFLESRD